METKFQNSNKKYKKAFKSHYVVWKLFYAHINNIKKV